MYRKQVWRWLPGILMVMAPMATAQIDLNSVDATDYSAVETARRDLNHNCPESTNRCGDRQVFELGLQFVQDNQDPDASRRFIEGWLHPVDLNGGNSYWRDVSHLYRYFAGLEAAKLLQANTLPADLQEAIIPLEAAYAEAQFLEYLGRDRAGVVPNFFQPDQTPISLGLPRELSPGIRKTAVVAAGDSIGFLIDGDDLRLDFLFRGHDRIDYDQLTIEFPERQLVADFPLPMHTGGAKLIELGIKNGEVINHIFSGGRRRTGMIVIDQEGRAFPHHVQHLAPTVWGSGHQHSLNLSRSVDDLQTFLQLANTERLSVVMGMLLLDEVAGTSLRPIRQSGEGGGRRLVVWHDQQSGNPALLVVGQGYGANHAVWVAHQLGFHWGIYIAM
ncbi:MAG: hypothetical protein ABIF77_18185 [bacterium]